MPATLCNWVLDSLVWHQPDGRAVSDVAVPFSTFTPRFFWHDTACTRANAGDGNRETGDHNVRPSSPFSSL